MEPSPLAEAAEMIRGAYVEALASGGSRGERRAPIAPPDNVLARDRNQRPSGPIVPIEAQRFSS